jgi:hypothetical protein
MSSNLDAIIQSCSSCSFVKDAEEDFFEHMQERLYSKIQNLEAQIEKCECWDEFTCRNCSEVHLEILRQHVLLKLNEEHYLTQTFLCDLHKSNVHDLIEDGILQEPCINSGCSDACSIHCMVEWD